VQASTQESIQYFLTFDDVINYLHLGRGVGSISIAGVAYPDCNGQIKALAKFFKVAGQNRGKMMGVSFIGGGSFSGPLISVSASMADDGIAMVQFGAQIAMTNHSLGGSTLGKGNCGGLSSNSDSSSDSLLGSSGGGLGSSGGGAGGFGNSLLGPSAGLSLGTTPSLGTNSSFSGGSRASAVGGFASAGSSGKTNGFTTLCSANRCKHD
jgi:hypothetical protein